MKIISKIIKVSALIFFTLLIQHNVFGQTVWNFPHTGTYSSVTLSPGVYKLETWGAEGGMNVSPYGGRVSGKGGYAKGELTLINPTTAYIYVGGKGTNSTVDADDCSSCFFNGGFNGGGKGVNGGAGGGGASDIRIGGTALSNRIIVAGGAGGAGYQSGDKAGGYGGGTSGGNGDGSGKASSGTQSSGYALGVGGNYNSTNDCGGGGGGFYGGNGGYTTNSSGAGGSGYIGGVLNGSIVAGNALMPNPSGGPDVTGREGNGYARITLLCDPPSLTISSTHSLTYGDEGFSITHTTSSPGVITYHSDSSVASIDNSGNVTINGAGTANLTVSQAASGNYCADTATMVLTVAKKPITVNGITANDKEYDSTTSVVLNSGSISYNGGVINGDDVTSTFTGVFSNEHVGTGITVNLTGSSSGADIGNYSITYQLSTTASITAKDVTISGVTASDKEYDGNTTSTIDKSSMSLSGVISGDDFTNANTTVTGAFSTAGIGNNKTVNLTYTYAGSDFLNYNITPQTTTQASITAPTYHFTNAGATGRSGPTQTQINSTYSSGPLNGNVTVTDGIQYWTVPRTGSYKIEAAGAKGGDSNYQNGGKGARMIGVFNLNQGEIISILVGQKGVDEGAGTNDSQGGGGGSFVWKNADGLDGLLIAAGGGGGASRIDYSYKDANTTTTANDGYFTSSDANPISRKGLVGYGGYGGDGQNRGVGGAGWYGNSEDGGVTSNSTRMAYSPINSGKGGIGGDRRYTNGSDGGFGGGGGGGYHSYSVYGGGGGGYTGGGGASWNSTNSGPGGGGGSYNSGTNQVNTAGINSGHGYVKITPLFSGGKVELASNSSDLQQFCSETIDPNILNVSQAAGGDTPFTYQWEESTDGNTWIIYLQKYYH